MASANLRYLALRKRLAAVYDTGAAPTVILNSTLRELYRSLPHYSVIALFRVDGERLVRVGVQGAEVADAELMAAGLARVAMERQQPVLLADVTGDARVRPALPVVVGELVVPIVQDGRTVGVIDIQSERRNGLGQGDRELLQWLAVRLRAAIQEAATN